jgi:hypothetical protein
MQVNQATCFGFFSKPSSRLTLRTLVNIYEELYRLYDEADLVTTIKITRLRWAGHVMRMQDNLPCKKITLDKPEGRRREGRPNLRWIDGVTKDAEKLGVRNWRASARDRDDWRRLLDSAKTLHGL